MASEFYNLAFSSGFDYRSSSFLKALSFPNDSEFASSLGKVSVAFLPISLNEYAFVQIQRRREYESGDLDPIKSRGRWFNQTRFVVLTNQEVRSFFSEGFTLFSDILYKNNPFYRLEKFDHVVGEIEYPEQIALDVPDGKFHRSLLFEYPNYPTILLNIDRVVELLVSQVSRNESVLAIYPKGMDLYERLLVAQSVQRILLPTRRTPISFSLDYLVYPLHLINLRFLEAGQENKSKVSSTIYLDETQQGQITDFAAGAFQYFQRHKFNWILAHEKYYKDDIAQYLISKDKGELTEKWLSLTLNSSIDQKPNLTSYYELLLNIRPSVGVPLFEKHFLLRLDEIIKNKKALLLITGNLETANKFLNALIEVKAQERYFTTEEWAKLILNSEIDLKRMEYFLDLTINSRELFSSPNILKLIDEFPTESRRKAKQFIYSIAKRDAEKSYDSAVIFLDHIQSWLNGKEVEEEIGYWCKFLPIRDVPISNMFNNLSGSLFLLILTEIVQNRVTSLNDRDIDILIELARKSAGARKLLRKVFDDRKIRLEYLRQLIVKPQFVEGLGWDQNQIAVNIINDKNAGEETIAYFIRFLDISSGSSLWSYINRRFQVNRVPAFVYLLNHFAAQDQETYLSKIDLEKIRNFRFDEFVKDPSVVERANIYLSRLRESKPPVLAKVRKKSVKERGPRKQRNFRGASVRDRMVNVTGDPEWAESPKEEDSEWQIPRRAGILGLIQSFFSFFFQKKKEPIRPLAIEEEEWGSSSSDEEADFPIHESDFVDVTNTDDWRRAPALPNLRDSFAKKGNETQKKNSLGLVQASIWIIVLIVLYFFAAELINTTPIIREFHSLIKSLEFLIFPEMRL
jgi:hypothetical protein